MYVDSSRLQDLIELKAEMEDPYLDPLARKLAHRAYKKIQSQLNDKKLSQMRERLAKATDKADRYETWKIRNQIKDYLGEEVLRERNY